MKHFDVRKLWAALALALVLCLAAPAVLPAQLAPGCGAQAAAKVKLSKTKATLYLGQTLRLKLKNAKGTVKWKSSKKSVATVSSKGKVKAKKAGSATITATYGKKKYTCKITVKKGLTTAQANVSLLAGDSAAITISQKAAGNVTISSSNAQIATAAWQDGGTKVGKNTLVITALGSGKATLKLTNVDTKESLSVKVTVSNKFFVLEKATDANLTVPVFQPFTLPKSVQVYLYANSGSEDRMLTADIADDSIAECYWDYYGWLGDDYRYLYVRGLQAGSTTITLSNSVNSETITIKVTVV